MLYFIETIKFVSVKISFYLYNRFDENIYCRCRHENEMEINKIINDQLTCGKCFKQFGSIQALKKHLEAKKCQGNYIRVYVLQFLFYCDALLDSL